MITAKGTSERPCEAVLRGIARGVATANSNNNSINSINSNSNSTAGDGGFAEVCCNISGGGGGGSSSSITARLILSIDRRETPAAGPHTHCFYFISTFPFNFKRLLPLVPEPTKVIPLYDSKMLRLS